MAPRSLLPQPYGRFDFPKFSLIFAPGISIILFYIYQDLEKVSALKDENSLDAKEANLYSKNAKITLKLAFYIRV